MEFACGFVYVPPSVTQQTNCNVFKRSALLPPANWMRPRTPPPPPPVNPAEDELQKPIPSPSKIVEQFEKSKEVKVVRPRPASPFYENAAFHNKPRAAASSTSSPPPTTPPVPPRKTKALLPPNMRHTEKPSENGQPLPSTNTGSRTFTYDLAKSEPDLNAHPWDPNDSYSIPETSGLQPKLPPDTNSVSALASGPTLPPRPSFMKSMPLYLALLPANQSLPSSAQKSPTDSRVQSPKGSEDKTPLLGNPNVVLVSLGKLLTEEPVQTIPGEPAPCSRCGSAPNPFYDKAADACYFCQTGSPGVTRGPGCRNVLFSLCHDEKPLCATDALLLFCIDISGSMSITSKVSEGKHDVYGSRLHFVQEAVQQCVQRLSEQQPHTRVGLISFNHEVTMHGHENLTSRTLDTAELIDSDYLKEAADDFPSPPPLSQTKHYLQREVAELRESGATALGPAALLAIAVASRQPGSKVIICTDGKANTELGNLEVEDNDARTLLSSTIFYQDLGKYAANQGVTVSVLSIEGTDCRLDELGRLADRTGGKVVIASPNRLHPEFEEIIENRTIATHCTVTLLLPQSLHMRGEREAGHKVTREVGNVNPDTEITFQFGANEQGAEVSAPVSGSHISIQLQIRYRQRDGQKMFRVITSDQEVTDDSLAALSSLSLAIIQLNSSQASAALAVRGRFLDARREGELQMKLIERAIECNRNADDKLTYEEWVKTMEPVYGTMHNYTRRKSVVSDSQSLTDAGAALLYTMKHCNRKSISLKNKQRLRPTVGPHNL